MSPPVARVTLATGLVALVAAAALAGPAVVADAAADGATITQCTDVIASGTYRVAADLNASNDTTGPCIEVRASGVVLEGGGHAVAGDGSGIGVGGASGVDSVTVRNLTLTDLRTGVSFVDASNVTLAGLAVVGTRGTGSGAVGDGVYLRNVDGATVVDSSVRDTGGDGLYLREVTDATVAGNRVRSANGTGVGLLYARGVVERNTVTGSGASGVHAVYSHGLLVRSNVVANSGRHGVSVQGGGTGTGPTNVTLLANTVTGSAGNGLQLESVTGSVARGNVVRDSRIGVHVHDARNLTLAGGRVAGATLQGVVVDSSAGVRVADLAVAATARDGVVADEGTDLAVENVTLADDAGSALAARHGSTLRAVDVSLAPNATVSAVATDAALDGTATAPPDPKGYANVGRYVDVDVAAEGGWVDLRMQYDDADLGDVNESTLRLWRHDGAWQFPSDANRVNETENYAAANVTRSGTVAPLGATDDGAVTVEGFEVRPADGRMRVAFQSNRLLSDVAVRVTDETGETVRTLTESNFTADDGTYAASFAVADPGTYTATLVRAAAPTGRDGAANQTDAATAVAVGLAPATRSVDVSSTARFDVVVEAVDGGVGAYEFAAVTSNATRAPVTGVDLGGAPGDGTVEVADDGSRATASAALANTSDRGAVTVATVSLRGQVAGGATVPLRDVVVAAEGGERYLPVAVDGANLTVDAAPPVVVGDARATDPDGDGVYEDVNGDGAVDVVDVHALFVHRDETAVRYAAAYFDVTGDGRVDVADVQALFADIGGEE